MSQETKPRDDVADHAHIDLIETYFDENADDWSDLYGKAQRVNDLVLAARKDAAVAHLSAHVTSDARVLDIGCGAGMTSVDLMNLGCVVHGVDISSKMLDHARKNFERAGFPRERYELTCAGMFGADLETESYDAIAGLGFLQYQDDEAAALAELHRVLKPGGVLVITGPTQRKLANWLGMSRYYYALRRRLKRERKPAPAAQAAQAAKATQATQAAAGGSEAVLHQISTHAYSFGRFRKLLEQAGFEVTSCKGHGYVNFEIIGRRIGQGGELFLHRFFSAIAKVLPIGRWANDLIVVAKKR